MHATIPRCPRDRTEARPVPSGRSLAGWLPLLVAVGACAPASVRQDPPKEAPPPPVAVAAVEQREVTIEQTYVGTVTPARISTVSSPVEGLVVEFLADEGDYVRGGREREVLQGEEPHELENRPEALPLARLRTESLEIEIAAAEAELEVRKAELKELEASKPKEIEQAEARKDAAKFLMEFTRRRLERARELHAKEFAVTKDELEERESAVQAAEEAFEERKAAWELAAQTDYWEEKIKQAQARVQVQQETINRLKDELEQHAIYAPFDGYVTQEHTEVGQWVAKGSPVAEMVDLNYVDIEVPVLESYVSQLRQPAMLFHLGLSFQKDLDEGTLSAGLRREFQDHGKPLSEEATIAAEEKGCRWQISDRGRNYTVTNQKELEVYAPGTTARVEFGALPGRVFQGEVAAIVPAADVRSRSFPVKVRLENPENPANPNELVLKPGMFARVTLPAEKRKMLLVPKDALVLGGASPSVWVVTPGSKDTTLGLGKAQNVRVEVDLRVSENRWIEILGPLDENRSLPLEPGQLVIVEGNERIVPGLPVNVVEVAEPRVEVSKARPAGLAQSQLGSDG